MYTLKLKHHIDSAHNLKHYDGACANLHGHKWLLEVVIKTNCLENDMVVDFKTIKKILNEFDHCYLNDKVDFNPTAENLAKFFCNTITDKTGLINEVTIWESPEASITYSED